MNQRILAEIQKLPIAATDILVTEDDPLLQSEICRTFSEIDGFTVKAASTALETFSWLDANASNKRCLLILDLGLPDADGIDVLSMVTLKYKLVAIVVVTARIDIDSKLSALTRGADAYLCKPFDQLELLATVAAVCRRVFNENSSITQFDNQNWRLIVREWLLVSPNGERIKLTVTETRLLELLQRNHGKPVSRMKIGEVMGSLQRYSGNALEATVSRLRRKVSNYHPDIEFIRASSGNGYVLTVPLE